MGYMGFGMRKEVYARKAKKAFSKLKDVYGDARLPKSNIKIEKVENLSYEKHSYKPFFENKTYKKFKIILLSLIVLVVSWSIWIQPNYDKYRREQFEKFGFSELYNSELTYFNKLFRFTESNRSKLISIQFYSWSKEFEIRLKHPKSDYANDRQNIHHLYFDGESWGERVINNDSIVNESLFVTRTDKSMEYHDNWAYHLSWIKSFQIPATVRGYLNLSDTVMRQLFQASKYDTRFRIEPNGVVTRFAHPEFGDYHLIYSGTKPESHRIDMYGDKYEVVIGQLDDSVFWSRDVSYAF